MLHPYELGRGCGIAGTAAGCLAEMDKRTPTSKKQPNRVREHRLARSIFGIGHAWPHCHNGGRHIQSVIICTLYTSIIASRKTEPIDNPRRFMRLG